MRQINSHRCAAALIVFTSLSAAILSACGSSDPGTSAAPSASTRTITLSFPGGTGPLATAIVPAFHAAAIALEEPSDVDALEPSASAHLSPHTQRVPAILSQLSTRRLSREVIDSVLQGGDVPAEHHVSTDTAQGITPASATGTLVTTFTPAQLRAAYNLPAFPAPGTTLTSAQAAALGAGQTIYIVDAGLDANAATELAYFSTKFGLPQCATASALSAKTALPLPPQSATSGCTFLQVYASPTGTLTAAAPAVLDGWGLETALDIEASHAIAPLARIVLVEAVDNQNSNLLAAISLANSMGPGVVSMSFAGPEDPMLSQFDATVFSGANMTYLASTGDSGAGVAWPAVSAKVIGVGGTTLAYDGINPRTETLWTGTGGGVSAFTALPSYQNISSVLGMFPAKGRIVADVSMDADPNSGLDIVYYPLASSTSGSWVAAGGTSLSSPLWAGLLAAANAERAASHELPLGDAHTVLYSVAQSSLSFGASIFDIKAGANGGCAVCNATIG